VAGCIPAEIASVDANVTATTGRPTCATHTDRKIKIRARQWAEVGVGIHQGIARRAARLAPPTAYRLCEYAIGTMALRNNGGVLADRHVHRASVAASATCAAHANAHGQGLGKLVFLFLPVHDAACQPQDCALGI